MFEILEHLMYCTSCVIVGIGLKVIGLDKQKFSVTVFTLLSISLNLCSGCSNDRSMDELIVLRTHNICFVRKIRKFIKFIILPFCL